MVKRRENSFSKMFVYPVGGEPYQVAFDFGDDFYTVDFGPNPDSHASSVRIIYESYEKPRTDIACNLHTGEQSILKQKEVPGYNPEDFETSLIYAPAEDGEQIPITLVHKKDVPRNGSAPLILEGYGS